MFLPDSRRDRARMAALLAVATMTVMSTVFIAPALPAMAAAFAGQPDADFLVKLSMTLPSLSIVLCAPLMGWAVDRFGRRRILLGSMLLYGAAGSAGYLLQDLTHIIISRLFLGLGIAGTMTTTTTLAGDYFDGESRTRFARLQSVVMSLGAMALVGIAGVVSDFGWRYAFLLYLVGWVLFIPVMLAIDEPSRGGHAAQAGGGAPPAAPPRGQMAAAYAISVFCTAMYFMVPTQLPFVAQEIGITSALLAGVGVGLASMAAAAGSALYTRIRRGRGFLYVYVVSFGLMGTGYALIGLVPAYPALLLGAIISGIGVGLFYPNGTLWVLSLAPPAWRGRVAGGLTASFNFGQFSSPLVAQPAVAATSLHGAFALAAGLMATVAVVFAFVREPRPPRAGNRADA